MTTTETGSLRLNRLIVSNFMRIESMKIDARGQHVLLEGKNRSGKTSAVDAIWACLGGKPSKDMPEPIRRGADKATVRLELCGADGKVEYIAERIWETGKDGSKLTIVDAGGAKKPAKIADGWIGKWMMNPKRFMDARPQDQLEELLGVAGVVPPVDDVAAILGERIEAKEGESADAYLSRLCGDGVGVIYHRRTLAHQTAGQKAKAATEASERLMQLGGPLEEGEKELTASEVIKQIELYQVDQELKREKTAEAASVRQKHREGAKKISDRKIDRARQDEQADEIVRQIEALQRQLEERRKSIAALDKSIVDGSAVVAEADADARILEEQAAMPDRAREIEACRLKLASIEHTNLRLAKRRHAGEELDRLHREAAGAECDHKTLDGALESLRNLRAHQLDGMDLGIAALEVGDGELRLNGISFKQASQAERLRVACLVAFKQNPKLRLIRVDEAECFDSESMQMLLSLADQYDFQVIETRVSDVEALKWEIVEAVAA